MRNPARRGTYADLEQLPEHLTGELMGGDLYVSPRPAIPHAHATSALGIRVGSRFHGPPGDGVGGWWIFDEPELHLHGDVLVPDLAGWRRERMPHPPRGVGVEVPPDWVCEVLSESTRRVDRAMKMQIYARERVSHLWLIEPLAHTVEVFRLEGARWTLLGVHEGAARVALEPFESFTLDLDFLWLPEEEPPAGGDGGGGDPPTP